MKIEIDTKEDLHNIRHIIQLLQAISANASVSIHKRTPGIFDEMQSAASSASPNSSSSDANPFASLFGDPTSTQTTSSSQASSSTNSGGFFSMFDAPPASSTLDKKEEPKGDFIDSLEVY